MFSDAHWCDKTVNLSIESVGEGLPLWVHRGKQINEGKAEQAELT